MQNALLSNNSPAVAVNSKVVSLPPKPAPTGLLDSPRGAVRVFLHANSHLAAATMEFYGHALNRFVAFCDAHGLTTIPEDLPTHIPAFISFLQAGGAGGRTVQQYLNVLKIMLRSRGVELKATHRIPAGERKESKIKAMGRWLCETEVAACLTYRGCPTRNQLIIRLLVETGARVQELAGLEAADVNLAERMAWIRTSKTMPRPVFFSDKAARLFESVFVDVAAGRLFPSAGQVKVIVNGILEELGLKTAGDRDGRGSHTFRHYCATFLFYEGGMDLNDIATYLGDEPDTIRSTYLHPTPAMMRKRVGKAWGWI